MLLFFVCTNCLLHLYIGLSSPPSSLTVAISSLSYPPLYEQTTTSPDHEKEEEISVFTNPRHAQPVMLALSMTSCFIYVFYSILLRRANKNTSSPTTVSSSSSLSQTSLPSADNLFASSFFGVVYLSVLWILVLCAIIFCMGGPFDLSVPLLSLYMCSVTLWPLSSSLPSLVLPSFLPLLLPSVFALLGAWMGAIVLPLSHDPYKPWKQWPVPCLLGVMLGNAAGCLAALLLLGCRRVVAWKSRGSKPRERQRRGGRDAEMRVGGGDTAIGTRRTGERREDVD
eukprot:GHVS01028932.1.p1 GENE.GHVS01028932.1~~GHVS01028932.1.p1  ORF type:complete len:283 (-),score=49.52 GHVS01028932.1:162-1010(-)